MRVVPPIVAAALFALCASVTGFAVTTRGGPGYTTQILPYWAYLKGFQGGALSQGAAVALFLFPVLLAASILALRMAYHREGQ
jgi:multiple sugar transport system permease protein